MKIINHSKNICVADQVEWADTPLSRLKGLLFRSSLTQQEGLIITQCRSIHMLFMRFPIDVIFADKHQVVIGLVPRIKPFRFSPYFWRAHYAIELFPGIIEKTNTQKGDFLRFE